MKVRVDELFVEGNVGGCGWRKGFLGGKGGDLVGAYGGVDGRLYRDGGGEWEHK